LMAIILCSLLGVENCLLRFLCVVIEIHIASNKAHLKYEFSPIINILQGDYLTVISEMYEEN